MILPDQSTGYTATLFKSYTRNHHSSPLSDSIQIEANLTQFDILKDFKRTSASNPESSSYTREGQVQDYRNSGWKTSEIKIIADNVAENWGAQGVQWINGIRKEWYELTSQTQISIGIDNITDERAYVAHPWPGRTAYLSFSVDL